jgi:hypothetical protein
MLHLCKAQGLALPEMRGIYKTSRASTVLFGQAAIFARKVCPQEPLSDSRVYALLNYISPTTENSP